MDKKAVRTLALKSGFKLRTQPDGTTDLSPYVYNFARAIGESDLFRETWAVKDMQGVISYIEADTKVCNAGTLEFYTNGKVTDSFTQWLSCRKVQGK